MTRKEFKELSPIPSLGCSIVYSNKGERIATVTSFIIRNKRHISIWDGPSYVELGIDNIEDWEVANKNNELPLFVKYALLKKEFDELKKFVHDRLK